MIIDVVGAGPAGSYVAYLLAKKGHSVKVYEKQKTIGKPIQCTGILSEYFTSLMNPSKKFVLNTVTKTRINSPNNNYVETKIKKNYVICRNKFDNYIANLAKKEGVKFNLEHSFHSFEKQNECLISKIKHKGKNIKSKSDILIGADGPLSPVSKSANLFCNRQFLVGTQIEVKHINDNIVDFFPYLGSYAWIVPVNRETVRIGVAGYKNTTNIFKQLTKKHIGTNFNKKTIENQSGVIPIFNPNIELQKDNVYLIGDAATMLKSTTGGGINQSLKAAEILANCIYNNKNYNKEWRKLQYKNLHTHLIIHKMMTKFTNNDWNKLIEIFNQSKMKKILQNNSRDNLISMLIKIAINNPSLFMFSKYFPLDEVKNLRGWVNL
jgi:digeranylgeranylglycerophospholipid reductase